MAYTFAQAQTEFFARGFDYLTQDAAGRARAQRYIVEAYLEDVCADEPWDFLRTSATGTTPLTVSDCDTIIAVRDTTNDNVLTVADHGYLENFYGDLTFTGLAEFVYFTGETSLASYPVSTATVKVDYFKVPTEPSADSDTFLVPSRWQGLILDFAVIRAYIDSDNFEGAQWLEQRAQRRLAKMRESEMVRSADAGFIQPSAWYW